MTTPVHYRDATLAYVETAQSPQTLMSAYAFAASDRSSVDLVQWIAERAGRLVPLRQRMVRPLGDIGLPVWSDDPEFAPERHIQVHEARDWDALCALLPTIHASPFDWSRPLWEGHLIRGVHGVGGLDKPCDVVVVKVHHAVADGKAGTEIARSLFGAQLPAEYVPGKPTSRTAVTARAGVMLPVTVGRLVGDLARYRRAQKQVRAELEEGRWKAPAAQWPRTAVNQKLGPGRVVDVAFFDIAALRVAAERIAGVTVNDLVLTIIGGALADYLGETDGSLSASMPISTRDVLDTDTRNRFTTATVDLHTEITDAAYRVHAVHDTVRAERDRKLSPANVRADAAAPRLPGFAIRAVVRLFGALPKRSPTITVPNVLATSVPMGRTDGWELSGYQVIANFGMSTLVDPGGVGHRISSIGDCLAISVTADPGQVPDLAEYMGLIRRGYERLIDQVVEESVVVREEGGRFGS